MHNLRKPRKLIDDLDVEYLIIRSVSVASVGEILGTAAWWSLWRYRGSIPVYLVVVVVETLILLLTALFLNGIVVDTILRPRLCRSIVRAAFVVVVVYITSSCEIMHGKEEE